MSFYYKEGFILGCIGKIFGKSIRLVLTINFNSNLQDKVGILDKQGT
jgi:hypothetical protein